MVLPGYAWASSRRGKQKRGKHFGEQLVNREEEDHAIVVRLDEAGAREEATSGLLVLQNRAKKTRRSDSRGYEGRL